MLRVAKLTGIEQIGRRDAGARIDPGALDATTEIHPVRFAERHAEANGGALGRQLVVTPLILIRLGGSVIDIDGPGYPVRREIGIGGADHDHLVVLAGVDLQAQRIPRAERIFLIDAERQRQLVGAAVTGTHRQTAGGLFLDTDVQIHLVGRARHVRCFNIHFGEKPQPVDTVAGQFDFVAVVPGRLELAKFAANHFVARAVIATDIDAAHIGAPGRVGRNHEGHTAIGAVNLRPRFHMGKCKSEFCQKNRQMPWSSPLPGQRCRPPPA